MTAYSVAQRVVWAMFGVSAAGLVGLGAWDVYLLAAKGGTVGASASRVILGICQSAPWVPLVIGLALGILIGHLTVPQVVRVSGP